MGSGFIADRNLSSRASIARENRRQKTFILSYRPVHDFACRVDRVSQGIIPIVRDDEGSLPLVVNAKMLSP